MDELRSIFYDDLPYGILYIAYNGLRIDRFKTKEEMDKVYEAYKNHYKFIKRVRIKDIKN